MVDLIRLWCYGVAALIDTVLLFALLERPNRRAISVWMLLLAVGVWCWHGGTFIRTLVDQSVGPLADPVRWLTMLGMTFGLLLMPSAALHGTLRLLRHGEFQRGPQRDARLLICYLPLLLLWPMGQALAVDPQQPFLDLLTDYRVSYAVWLCLVSGLATFALFRTSSAAVSSPERWFYQSLGISMLLIASLTALFVTTLSQPSPLVEGFQTVVGLSPLIPALLFAYFIMRFQLLPLVLERTLVYGAVLMGVMMFHHLILRRWVAPVEDRYRLNVGVLEGIASLMAVLLYSPLRLRVTEALHSLVDAPGLRRGERQRLAVQLAARAGDSPTELLPWFVAKIQEAFGVKSCAAWLCQPDGRVAMKAGAVALIADHDLPLLLEWMGAEPFVTRLSTREPRLAEVIDRVRIGALLKFSHGETSGLFLVGCQRWGQPPSDEDLHALSLLVEQFGITLHNSQLLALQVAAEHRLLQQEKLSTLGLVAGSLAHEIKNPLSSIKTITRVLEEELGPQSPHAEDIRMIREEVERLAASTVELLEAARPPRTDRPATSLATLLAPTLRLLKYAAREQQATLEVVLPDAPVSLALDQLSLREIVFNLTANGLEAAGQNGVVSLRICCDPESLTLEIQDNGPGIPPEQQARLFEPFFTTKPSGTGLGLYIVARRVREIGGRLECRSAPQQGTTFLVELPRPAIDPGPAPA